MAHKIISSKWSGHCNDYVKEFICDTDDDFNVLPKACAGSTAVSIETGAVRVVNASGEWVDFAKEG